MARLGAGSPTGRVSAINSSYAARPRRMLSTRPPLASGSQQASETRTAAERSHGASEPGVLANGISTPPRLKSAPLGRRGNARAA